LNQFKVIALTHRTLGLDLVGKYHVEPEEQAARFADIEQKFLIREFMFLSTCNRVEFFMRTSQELSPAFVTRFLTTYFPNITTEEIEKSVENARMFDGIDAIRHMFHVASSLDSLVIGEREIITQVRNAFERCEQNGFSGDFVRIAIQKAIETAKQVYTETEIATKPVSVVNLAYRQLLEKELHSGQRIVYVGAGTTIEAIAGNLKAHDFESVKVFNRTKKKAHTLANALGGQGYSLTELKDHCGSFDVLVTCTGAEGAIIDDFLYEEMLGGDLSKKIIVDLAIPNDIDASVLSKHRVDYIAIEDLKVEAKRNLKAREKEIFRCEALVEERLNEFEIAFKTRKLELAMHGVPQIMKDIKTRAVEKTFAKEIEALDSESKETLDKILNYLEKKYIAVPMKMAKQVMLDQDLKDPIIE
jgi:glutamyl-tRNA reductase